MIYENDPPGHLTERFDLEEGVAAGSMAWGDYDNDGDLDLAVIGNYGQQPSLKLYRNDANSFPEDRYRKLAGVDFGAVSWCDIDRDGDLDLFTAGRERVEDAFPRASVNDNLEGKYNPNRPPDPPRPLPPVPEGSEVLLSWEAGGDLETGSKFEGLMYTLRVGSSSEADDVLSGATGLGAANVGHGLSHRLTDLKSGTYHWSVRTVDPGFARSGWSEEGSFIIDTEKPVVEGTPSVKPNRVGIDQDVMVVVKLHDEHTDLDTSFSPTVSFFPEGDPNPVPVEELRYEGETWTGTVTISDTIPSGAARLLVSGARDGRGNVMEDWILERAFDVDTEVPEVIRMQPNPGQVGVSRTPRIEATFSEDVEGMTIGREGLLHLMQEDNLVPVTFVGYNPEEREIIFTPIEVLSPRKEYEVIVSSQVQDLVGNRMASDVRWRFETAPVVEARFGGTVENDSRTIRLYIPPNALEADQEVSLAEELPEVGTPPEGDVRFTGLAFRFDPDTTSLRKPCALTVVYGKDEEVEEKLALFWRVQDAWTRLGGTVDAEVGEITTSVNELGTFALFEDTSPGEGKPGLSDLDLSPRVFSPGDVAPAQGGSAKLLGALPGETNISFVLIRDTDVTIEIYNESGRLERVLMENRPMTRGRATVAWDGRDEEGKVVSSGLYIAVIRAGDLQEQKTVAVLNK